jgi:flagellar export protein FliJ
MKRFVFRLERVLGIRRFELERARLALAEVEAEAIRLAARVALAERRLDEGRRILEQESCEGADGPRLALRALAVRSGRTKWLLARQQTEAFEPTRARARERVRRCRARVESLERLRENRADLHRKHALASEQAELEGLAMARFARSRLLGVLLCVLLTSPLAARAQGASPASPTAAGAPANATESTAAGAGAGGKSRAQPASPPPLRDGSAGLPDATASLLAGPGFSKGVDLILAEVRGRELELARRELELGERESAVKELETMVAERAGELEKIRANVETRILAWSAQGGDRIEQLSGVYSAMPPADAANLLAKLDLDLAVSVIRQMKKKVSASVLAAMKPDRALLVSRRILQPLDPRTDPPPARPY